LIEDRGGKIIDEVIGGDGGSDQEGGNEDGNGGPGVDAEEAAPAKVLPG